MNPSQHIRKILFWLGLSLPMLALIGMTWLVHQTGGEFNRSLNWVMQNYKIMDLFEQTQSHIVDAEANQRGYLLTARSDYLEPYQLAMQAVRENIADLKTLTRDDAGQQARIALLEKMVAEELVFDPATALTPSRTSANAPVVAVTERGKHKVESLRKILFQARAEQQEALSKHQQAAASDVVSGQLMSLVLIVAVAVALGLVVVILLRLEKLQRFVTICAWTGQVKHQGEWIRLDEFLRQQYGISVSHSMSKEAADKMLREIEGLKRGETTPPQT